MYDFQKFKRIRCFGREMFSGIITLSDDAFKKEINLRNKTEKFEKTTKPEYLDKKEKALAFENVKRIFKCRQNVLIDFQNISNRKRDTRENEAQVCLFSVRVLSPRS